MALINCTNKGCLKSSEAKLDTTTNKVVCDECGGVIDGITEAMKRMLKSFGQVVRSKNKQAFQVLCKKCNQNTEYFVDSDGKAYCKVCKSPVSVSPIFARATKINSKKKAKDNE